MTILIKKARVVDPSSSFNGKILDLFIENGILTGIAASLDKKADRVISIENLHVSPGWVDIFAQFGDPGFEYKETLESGALSAAAGGYTEIMVIPNTSPVVQNKSHVEYIIQKGRSLPVTIHPIGAVTKNAEGNELGEMYDMRASGAVAFSDGTNSLQSSGIMMKALQYVRAFNGIVIQLPDDKSIDPHGLMNEGVVSTRLGLPGKPAMAEELMVNRDIKLAEYADSKIHFTGISTSTSLKHIKEAKKNGIDVSCSVTPYHLFFCDEDLGNYDTNLKVDPPLRPKKERAELRKAIAKGEIDCIASHHLPHETDSKVTEFEYARPGMIGLETSFGAINTAVPGTDMETWVTLLSLNPRKIFGLEKSTIEKGVKASFTLFDPDKEWIPEEKSILSRSKNSAFTGKKLKGKPIGIINKDQVFLNADQR